MGLSTDGIYRRREDPAGARLRLLPPARDGMPCPADRAQPGLLHPKCRLPARCFAYVGSADDPRTWHLPYLRADGTPDMARLPKAIQAIRSNYRGAHLSSVPEPAIPEVLITLARTAHRAGQDTRPGTRLSQRLPPDPGSTRATRPPRGNGPIDSLTGRSGTPAISGQLPARRARGRRSCPGTPSITVTGPHIGLRIIVAVDTGRRWG